MAFDFNKFLDTGKNRTILKIIDAVIIGALSIATLYFAVIMIGTPTNTEYFNKLSSNLVMFLIFVIVDVLVIAFTKPLFGFTSVIDNFKARAVVRKREKEKNKAIEAEAKATLAAARAARKAKKAEGK